MADAAEMLAKEKRKVLDAMQEAKRLQAEANSKYEQAERLLAQFGQLMYHPSRRRPRRARRLLQRASSGYERIPIERES